MRTRRERGWRKKAYNLIQKRSLAVRRKIKLKKAALIRRRLSFEPEEENDDDEECFYCNEFYSKSKVSEGWIRCKHVRIGHMKSAPDVMKMMSLNVNFANRPYG